MPVNSSNSLKETVSEDYFRRNSGKKLLATILEPTEAEIKNQQTAQ